MHIRFKVLTDRGDAGITPDILPEVIDEFLNIAQDQFVTLSYGGRDAFFLDGFEESQLRVDDLSEIVFTRELGVTSYSFLSDAYSLDLYPSSGTLADSPYKYYVRGRAKVKENSTNTEVYRKVTVLTQDQVDDAALVNPFYKPKKRKPRIFYEEGKIIILTVSGFSITKFLLTYVKRPNKINSQSTPKVNSEVNENAHNKIVQLAVDAYLESIESNRINTNKQNLQRIE